MKQYLVRLDEGGHCFMVVESSRKAAIKRVEEKFGKTQWITENDLVGKNIMLELQVFNDRDFKLKQFAES